MNAIATPRGAQLVLNVHNADNQVVVFVNGVQAYTKATENDPTFHDTTNLSALLHPGRNVVLVIGINWGGPFHVRGGLVLNGNAIGTWDDYRGSAENGVVNYWSYVIEVA